MNTEHSVSKHSYVLDHVRQCAYIVWCRGRRKEKGVDAIAKSVEWFAWDFGDLNV